MGPSPPGALAPRTQGSRYTSNHACEAPWGPARTYLRPSPLERMEALPTTAPEEKQPATEPSWGSKQGDIAPPTWLLASGGLFVPRPCSLSSQGPVHSLLLSLPSSPPPLQGTQPHSRTCPWLPIHQGAM